MNPRHAIITIAILSATAIFAFQNCSSTKFEVDEYQLKPTGDFPGRSAGDDGQVSGPGSSPGDDGQRPGGKKNPPSGGNGDDGQTPEEVCAPQSPAPANRQRAALCAEATTVRFIAGQHYDVGDVSVAADNNELIVQIALLSGVVMSESHVDIASSPEALQVAPGQFRYQKSYNPASASSVYNIPFSDLNLSVGQTIYVRVHGVVGPRSGQENQLLCSSETAWAQGVRNGIGWSMYFEVKIAECP